MEDADRIFHYLENPKLGILTLKDCKLLIPSPVFTRKEIVKLIQNEIHHAQQKKPAAITLKMNSLSDEELIAMLSDAARAGVEIKLIIRGIFCMYSENPKFRKPIAAVSIVDEYLEHARVLVFHNRGKEKIFISSADWMVRNLDHRIETTCPIFDSTIKQELKDILKIQLKDNVKARLLNNHLNNEYVSNAGIKKFRSQIETYNYLYKKTLTPFETGSH
jgi:polyphosphate kinase